MQASDREQHKAGLLVDTWPTAETDWNRWCHLVSLAKTCLIILKTII